MRRAARPIRRRRGFTLIEAMATVTVLGALGSIASFLIVGAVDGYTDAVTAAQLHGELSVAMDRLAREARRIELKPAAAGAAPNVTEVAPSLLEWSDGDGDAWQVSRSGSTLLLQADGGDPAVLLTDVTSFAVTIRDEDGADLGPTCSDDGCNAVRRVELAIAAERHGVSETLRCLFFIRSTMAGASDS